VRMAGVQMKPWINNMLTVVAVLSLLIALLAMIGATNLTTWKNNASSFLVLVSWMPTWLVGFIASRSTQLVLAVLVSSAVAFLLGQEQGKRKMAQQISDLRTEIDKVVQAPTSVHGNTIQNLIDAQAPVRKRIQEERDTVNAMVYAIRVVTDTVTAKGILDSEMLNVHLATIKNTSFLWHYESTMELRSSFLESVNDAVAARKSSDNAAYAIIGDFAVHERGVIVRQVKNSGKLLIHNLESPLTRLEI
jgi:hypothetical protein